MARWVQLTDYLQGSGDVVELEWADFDRIVGGAPPSAMRHRAWWSGDRPQSRAWLAAGYRLSSVDPGRHVTFIRSGVASPPALAPVPMIGKAPSSPPPTREDAASAVTPDLVLVSCVKSKRSVPSAARDLYTSALFRGERTYAESTGAPWFILSAEHGLLAPDDVVAPYERYLPHESPNYRAQWGARVIDQIQQRFGDLNNQIVEIHAGSVYVGAIRSSLASRGATVIDRLQGLSLGQRLSWYAAMPTLGAPSNNQAPRTSLPDLDELLSSLSNPANATTPSQFLATGGADLRCPGLYSWWVDNEGAADLTRGLGTTLAPGLIYAGLAGATRWPSGKASTNTLWSRISGMHLGRNVELSTLRLTLTAVLSSAGVVPPRDEALLTLWMDAHLRVVAVPYPDADGLGRVEEDLLRALDPPLNLRGMESSPVRSRLTAARGAVKLQKPTQGSPESGDMVGSGVDARGSAVDD